VPGRYRVFHRAFGKVRLCPVINLDIGAAYARCFHLDQHVIRPDLGLIDIYISYVPDSEYACGFHRQYSSITIVLIERSEIKEPDPRILRMDRVIVIDVQ